MWYTGTYKCGHEGRINIIGPGKDRGYKIETRFARVCPNCWKLEEERKDSSWMLPELIGTKKEIIFAEKGRTIQIRRYKKLLKDKNHLSLVMYYYKKLKKEDQTEELADYIEGYKNKATYFLNLIKYYLYSQDEASWWIENINNDWEKDIVLKIKAMENTIHEKMLNVNIVSEGYVMGKVMLAEYARRHGIDPQVAKRRAQDKVYKTVEKMGEYWMIDDDEVFVDNYLESDK